MRIGIEKGERGTWDIENVVDGQAGMAGQVGMAGQAGTVRAGTASTTIHIIRIALKYKFPSHYNTN
jgi:hypothetical protein